MTAQPPDTRRDGGRRPAPGVATLLGMSRRVRVLIVTLVVFVILFVVMLTLPVPYVMMTPGPTFNTLGVDNNGKTIIVISGRTANKTTGHLNMTTVDVSTAPISAFDAVIGWLRHSQVVVPKAAVYPPNQTEQQTNKHNKRQFVQAQDSAIAAAACELGYPRRLGVVAVTGDGASYRRLRPSDLITSVDGHAVDTNDGLTAALAHHAPGTSVAVGILRVGRPRTVHITLGPPVSGRTGGSLGITVSTSVCQLPFHVDLGLANEIGGPSAGMMFALGIMDKVGSVNLTHGKFIAGTGTITPAGNVGPIGGIQLKMIAARDAGATVFLAPASNCPDVRGAVPAGLRVIKVSTLDGAVHDLAALNAGRRVAGC